MRLNSTQRSNSTQRLSNRCTLQEIMAQVITLQNPLTLPAFFSLANFIIYKTLDRHTKGTASIVSFSEISAKYNSETSHFECIKLEKTSPAENQKIISVAEAKGRHDVYNISSVLERLFEITDAEQYGKIGQIITFIISNELQAFRLKCDHYRDTDTTESLTLFANAFSAAHELIIHFPAQTSLDFLDINAVQTKIALETLGKFIQENYSHENFSEELIAFFKASIPSIHAHSPAYAYRDQLIAERDAAESDNASTSGITAITSASQEAQNKVTPLALRNVNNTVNSPPMTVTSLISYAASFFDRRADKSRPKNLRQVTPI